MADFSELLADESRSLTEGMIKTFANLTFVFSLMAIAHGHLNAQTAGPSAYKIAFEPGNTRLLKIEADLTAAGDIFEMSEYGAEQFPGRWAEFVRDLRAFGANGKPVEVEGLGDAKWRIAVKPGDKVRLNYDVLLDHDKHKWAAGIDSVSFVRDWGVYASGRTYFITNGPRSGKASVTFDLPKGWNVTTPWPAEKGGRNSFAARDAADLTESMIFAGTHKEFVIARDGFELVFAIGSEELFAQQVRYRSLANGVMDYYIKLMGGVPRPPPSNPFSRSVVIVSPGEQTDGEVIGNNICIIVGSKSDPMSDLFARFIFAHEFFHLWNGKSIRPKNTEDEWFKEGFTNIYAMKALYRIGAISEAELFGVLDGLFYKRYSTDESYAKASMRDVAGGDEKHKHWGLIYGGGMFAGLCIDTEIRRASGNERSLDDLMRTFYSRYSGSDRTYVTDDLKTAMSSLSKSDLSGFFTDHIYGAKPVPIDRCLNSVGLRAEIADGRLKVSRKPDASAAEERMIAGLLGK